MCDPTGALVETECVTTTGLVLDAPVSAAEPPWVADDGWARVEVFTLTAAERILDSLPTETRESRMVLVGPAAFVVEWRARGPGPLRDPELTCTPVWGLGVILALGLAAWGAAVLLISAYAG